MWKTFQLVFFFLSFFHGVFDENQPAFRFSPLKFCCSLVNAARRKYKLAMELFFFVFLIDGFHDINVMCVRVKSGKSEALLKSLIPQGDLMPSGPPRCKGFFFLFPEETDPLQCEPL